MVQEKSNPFVIYLFWVIATLIGWLAGIFNLSSSAKTYLDILRVLSIYLADGLLIGLIAGLGQALVLRKFTNTNSAWISATILGYGLTFLVGLIVSVLIPSLVWLSQGEYLLPFRQPATVSVRISIDDLFWGGMLLGAVQWPVLKKIIPNPSWNKGLLWVLANWSALGISFFIGALTQRSWLVNFQMGVMGVVVGGITGLVLLALFPISKPGERPSD